MLILHQSNRLEHLASALAQLLQSLPLTQAFTPETIVIQSQGMRRYISRFLATRMGVAANIDFSLPAKLMWQIMQQNLGEQSLLSPFSSNVLQWRLLQLFDELPQQSGSAAQYLANYIDSRAEAKFDLAYILADIFDQYLIYRYDWVEAWQNGRLVGLGDDELWQADLWRQLTTQESHQGEHRLQLWQRLQHALPTAKLPERLWVFGITSLAPMYLDLLQTLARYTDVHIFATNPCSRYWGDVIEPEWLLRSLDSIDASEVQIQQGHPLLASLGKQGRDFFDSITTELKPEHDLQLFADNPQPTLLARLQNDVLHLNNPSASANTTAIEQHPLLQDASIIINSAHSPLRELQILKDQIISSLSQHPDWQLDDIAVLMPKVDPYLPYLDAVFGAHCPDGHPLAYSVADVKFSQGQPYLQAVEHLLHLIDSRFELLDVLPLLDAPAVQQHYGWTPADIELLQATIRDLNIRWGLDAKMRRQFGGDDDAYTWQQALERVVLGWLLPQHPSHQHWLTAAPYASEPAHWALLAQWWQLMHTLQQLHQLWHTPATVADWVTRLQDALGSLLSPQDSDMLAWQHWQQHLLDWQQQAQLAGYHGELNFAVVKRHLSDFLRQDNQAGFLRGGISICSMIPMRGLPFKMLCLLGMNDGDFPRDTKAPSFDLIYQDAVHHRARKGDRSRRDDDRYLFLECLINVREQLYLSFVGKDLKKDDPLAASPVVYELIDAIAKISQTHSKDLLQHWVVQHPMQPFSSHYFDGQHRLLSHRQDLAEALNQPALHTQAFIDDAFEHCLQDASNQETLPAITMHEWLQFWRNPSRRWLEHNLALKLSYVADAWPEEEPFALEDNARHVIYSALYAARRDQRSFDDVEQDLLHSNQLPVGQLATLYFSDLKQKVLSLPSTWFQAQSWPAVTYTHQSKDAQLTISLDTRTDIGQIQWFTQKPNGPEKIQLWLKHLAYCAYDDSALPKITLAASIDGTYQLAPIDAGRARQLLDDTLHYWRLGQRHPLPFFARTSLSAAEKWHIDVKKNPDQANTPSSSATQAARKAFAEPGFQLSPQLHEPYVALLYGHCADNDLPIHSPLFWNIIHDVCLPMMDAMHTDSPEKNHANSQGL